MADNPTAETADRVLWGRALRALRLRRGVTIEGAATTYEPAGFIAGDPDKGMSTQRWHQIEKGGLKFTEEQRRRLTRALGSNLEELELERARILGVRPRAGASGVSEREQTGLVIPIWGRASFDDEGWKVTDAGKSDTVLDLRDLLVPAIGVTYVADDAMAGKAAAGAPVIFDRGRRPVEGKGCVLETKAGELYVRLYVGMDEEHVLVRSLATPGPRAFKRSEVKGVYAVKFWGD